MARLLALIRLRNSHPPFGGTFELLPSAAQGLSLRWQHGQAWAALELDLVTLEHRLSHSGPAGEPGEFRFD